MDPCRTSVVDFSGSGRHAPSTVKQVLALIEGEAQCMLCLRDQISMLPPQQRSPLHSGTLLNHIGVETPEDLDELVSVFCRGQRTSPLQVDVGDVLPLLRSFMLGKSIRRNPLPDDGIHGGIEAMNGARPDLGGSSARRLRALKTEKWCRESLKHGHLVEYQFF